MSDLPMLRVYGRSLVVVMACALLAAAVAVFLVLTMLGTPGTLSLTSTLTVLAINLSAASAVAFGPGGTTLAVGDANGSTYLWRLTPYNPHP